MAPPPAQRTEGFCISRQQSHQCQCLVSQLFDEMTWSKCLWTLSASSGSQIDYFFQACQIGIPLEKSGASGIHHWKRNSWSIWVRFFSTLFKIHQISDDVIFGSYQIFMLRKLWLSTFFSLILPLFYLAGRKDVRQYFYWNSNFHQIFMLRKLWLATFFSLILPIF